MQQSITERKRVRERGRERAQTGRQGWAWECLQITGDRVCKAERQRNDKDMLKPEIMIKNYIKEMMRAIGVPYY